MSSSAEASELAALPEAPLPSLPFDEPAFQASSATGVAPHYAKYIPSGWTAQPLSAGDKIVIGLRDVISPLNFAGIIVSTGYAHLTNGQPNYGTNGEAFGKRFGAGVARSSSQGVFTDALFSPLLHQDPRYYVEGSKYGFFHRLTYAATRPLIGRTDGGHNTVNAALLLGYASAAALTMTYYPQSNRNFHDVASTFGGSLGGAAIGFGVSEFSDDLLKAFHLRH